MTKYSSKSALFTKIQGDLITNNTSKENTAARVNEALEALYDTIGEDYLEVADLTTFASLSLSTDFKEYDICIVLDINEGNKSGIYRYTRTRSSGTLEWHLISKIGDQQILLSTQATLADYISTDYSNGDLALWDIVKLTDGVKYIVVKSVGTYIGDNTGDYEQFSAIGITALVDDTSPQLGGMLDVNGFAIGDGTLELLKFTETASAVNELTIKNAATGTAPELQATGDDTNIDLKIVAKGTGHVSVQSELSHTGFRLLGSQGTDIASANNLSLDAASDGNLYAITGTTQINLIDSTQWLNGSNVFLKFDGIVTIKDGQTTSGNYKKINLGGSDYETSAGDVLQLVLQDSEWWIVNKRQLEAIQFAISDEDSDLETGTAAITLRMPFAMKLTAVRASVGTAPTGANLILDINEAGTTILSTKLSIDAGEKTSSTAATAAVISDSSLADDAEITVDIDQIGSTVAGAGAKVTLIGYRS